jgi:type II secretory pathway pseudopilin PulG
MKVGIQSRHGQCAMTLVEMLLVVFVIAIFTAMLLPIIPNGHHRPAKMMLARVELASLATAIEAYESDYGRLPLADSTTNEDLTSGIRATEIQDYKKVDGTKLIAKNSDLVVVLMDFDVGVNLGHALNPKQIKYLNARMISDTNSPGVSIVDYQFRDPWGNPYIISLDANQDGFVRDAFYAQPDLFAIHIPTNLANINSVHQWHGKVMIWSRGPDGKASMTVPANSGVNKDNVVSWE